MGRESTGGPGTTDPELSEGGGAAAAQDCEPGVAALFGFTILVLAFYRPAMGRETTGGPGTTDPELPKGGGAAAAQDCEPGVAALFGFM